MRERAYRLRTFGIGFMLASLLLGVCAVPAGAYGTWSTTGSMASPRANHTAVRLPDGKMIMAGGFDGFDFLSSAELYDPAPGAWSATGSMAAVRCVYHTATLLPNGKVLVAGGYRSYIGYLYSAELYDPVTGTWAATGQMLLGGRTSATLLFNGNVLPAGGYNSYDGYLSSAEIYHSEVPGDYDGDGKTDIAVYRPAYGYWFIHRSSDGTTQSVPLESNVDGDVPVRSRY